MNKCIQFLEFFDKMVQELNVEVPDDVYSFYEMLKASQNNYIDKPEFTEIGLIVLQYLQECDITSMKAKEIADGVTLPSRRVSGAMRKLCDDGYVEKFGQNPVIYALTEKGKNIDLKKYKENV